MKRRSLTHLADCPSTLESGQRPQGGASADSGSVPSVGGENITQDGRLAVETVQNGFRLGSIGACGQDSYAPAMLMNKDGAQTGKTALYDGRFKDAAVNEHVFILRGKAEMVDQRYPTHLLQSENLQRRLGQLITDPRSPASIAPSLVRRGRPARPSRAGVDSDQLDDARAAEFETEHVVEKPLRLRRGCLTS